MALIRVAPAGAGKVRSYVQSFADAVAAATGADSFGTYVGHEPSLDLAVDIFVPVSSRVLGDSICAFALANIDRYSIDYVIYRQRIYNPEIARYWRDMADRGNPTANHMDHVHVSFDAVAPVPVPVPNPQPQPSMKELPMEFVYIANGEDWVLSTSAGFHGRLPYGETLDGLKESKQLTDLGKRSPGFHLGIVEFANQCGFHGSRD